MLRSDNGPEFVSRALLSWITTHGIDTALIEPSKPWQNGVGESFNGKLRDECLSLEWFRSRAEAKVVIEAWRTDYNPASSHPSRYVIDAKRFGCSSADPVGSVVRCLARRMIALAYRARRGQTTKGGLEVDGSR